MKNLLLLLIPFQIFSQTVEYPGTRIFKGTLEVDNGATLTVKGTDIDSIVVSSDTIRLYVDGSLFKAFTNPVTIKVDTAVISENVNLLGQVDGGILFERADIISSTDSALWQDGGLELTGSLKASTNRYKFFSTYDSTNTIVGNLSGNDTALLIEQDLFGDGSVVTNTYALKVYGINTASGSAFNIWHDNDPRLYIHPDSSVLFHNSNNNYLSVGDGRVKAGVSGAGDKLEITSGTSYVYNDLDVSGSATISNDIYITADTIADIGKENFLKLGATAGEGFDVHLNGNTDVLISAENSVRISGGGNLSYGIGFSDTTIEAHGGTTIYVNENFTTSGINRLGDAQSDTVVIPGWLKNKPVHMKAGFADSTVTITGGDSIIVSNGDSLFKVTDAEGISYAGSDTFLILYNGGYFIDFVQRGYGNTGADWKTELVIKRSGSLFYEEDSELEFTTTGGSNKNGGSQHFYYEFQAGDKFYFITTRVSGTGDFTMTSGSIRVRAYLTP